LKAVFKIVHLFMPVIQFSYYSNDGSLHQNPHLAASKRIKLACSEAEPAFSVDEFN